MQLEVLARKENPLLKRVEVMFKATHKAEATPTRDALRAFLAKELHATKDIVVIDSQASTFGRYETRGYAKVYKSKDEALAIERKHILIRNKLVEPEVKQKEGAPKPEKPAPAPKAEKPAPPPRAEAPKPEAPKPAAKPEAKPGPKAEKPAAKEEKKAAPKEEKKPSEKKEEKKEEKKAEPKKKGGK